MKQKSILLVLTFLVLTIIGCQEKKSSSSGTATSAYCTGTNYYTVAGCPGYGGGTTSGTGTTCTGTLYYTNPNCAGYCTIAANQNTAQCTGGTSSGGSSSGGTGTNCTLNPFSYACYCQSVPFANGCAQYGTQSYVSKNWGVKYPSAVVPSRACSATKNPVGVSGSLYETRKATVTAGGFCNPTNPSYGSLCAPYNTQTDGTYNPASPMAAGMLNTSAVLKSEAGAKSFFISDASLKIRFKANPEPDAASTSTWCSGRRTGTSMLPGAAKYTFNVTLVGTRPGGVQELEPLRPGVGFTVDVNGCSEAIDLSTYLGVYTEGMYVIITDVKSNKGGWPSQQQLDTSGFIGWGSFDKVRSGECWSFDIEVAADGTKTFDVTP